MKKDIERILNNGWSIYKLIGSKEINEIYAIFVSTRILATIPFNSKRIELFDIYDKKAKRYISFKYPSINMVDILFAYENGLLLYQDPNAELVNCLSEIQMKGQDLNLFPVRNMRGPDAENEEKKKNEPYAFKKAKAPAVDTGNRSTAKFNNDLAKANLRNQIKRNIIQQGASLGVNIPFHPRIIRP